MDEKHESLPDVTEELNNSILSSTKIDLDDWCSFLFLINARFGKNKVGIRKDDDNTNAHVLVNIPKD